jgi:hypothetical protein
LDDHTVWKSSLAGMIHRNLLYSTSAHSIQNVDMSDKNPEFTIEVLTTYMIWHRLGWIESEISDRPHRAQV